MYISKQFDIISWKTLEMHCLIYESVFCHDGIEKCFHGALKLRKHETHEIKFLTIFHSLKFFYHVKLDIGFSKALVNNILI